MNFTFPAGIHVCEVEMDPETGVTEIVKWVAVDDFGNAIRPMIAEGQVHPTLKQRLASPSDVVDPGGVAGLGGVRREGDAISAGRARRRRPRAEYRAHLVGVMARRAVAAAVGG